jgi:hypothetical protein
MRSNKDTKETEQKYATCKRNRLCLQVAIVKSDFVPLCLCGKYVLSVGGFV